MQNPLDPTTDYTVPASDSKYLKLEKGQTKFLPLGSAIVGFEYWTNDNKPVRIEERPASLATLKDIRQEDNGTYKLNHFWAFPVIDCKDGKVKVLELTQKGIQRTIRGYIQNEEWGSPVLRYTFTITREGDGFETKYAVMANPAREIPEDWLSAWDEAKENGFDITRLFDGGDPFTETVEL